MTKSISESERVFLEDGIDQGIRNDGRDLGDFRAIVIALDVISTANGSSRVKNDELDIIVAVKCEMVSADKAGSPTEGSIFVNVDCSYITEKISNIAPSFTDEDYSLYLTNTIKEMCFSNFDNSKLNVREKQLFWNIYIDTTILSFGGNIIDWVSIAISAALRSTRIPKITILPSSSHKETGGKDFSYTVSPSVGAGILFPYKDIPLIISAGYIRGKVVWDMNIHEQICSKTIIAFSINADGECISFNKIYSNTLDLNIIPTIINKAREISSEISKSLDDFFSHENI
ncbi:exosome complex component RRP42 [Cryptosporidium felis]|nr:exosome complex component RRP42 [Cryptosporidium felis]